MLKAITDYYDSMYKSYYGADLETVLSSSGMTMESFESQMLKDTIPTMMKEQMVFYSILDNEKIEIDEEIFEGQTIDNEVLKESIAVKETVVFVAF